MAEPQDVPIELRHYEMMRAQMALGDKPMFVYARGRRLCARDGAYRSADNRTLWSRIPPRNRAGVYDRFNDPNALAAVEAAARITQERTK